MDDNVQDTKCGARWEATFLLSGTLPTTERSLQLRPPDSVTHECLHLLHPATFGCNRMIVKRPQCASIFLLLWNDRVDQVCTLAYLAHSQDLQCGDRNSTIFVGAVCRGLLRPCRMPHPKRGSFPHSLAACYIHSWAGKHPWWQAVSDFAVVVVVFRAGTYCTYCTWTIMSGTRPSILFIAFGHANGAKHFSPKLSLASSYSG
jgi:hypothetical protein